MTVNPPLISVVMNCHNGEKYLKQALDSVISQTYSNIEIIFVDNCSTDGSADIAKEYNTHYFKTPFLISLGAARKFAIEKVKGDYVAFLDTDDIWLPDALKKLYLAIVTQNYALAYAGQISIDESNSVLSMKCPKARAGNLFETLLRQFDIHIVSALVSVTFLKKFNFNFDVGIEGSEEYCLFMQLAAKTKFISLAEPLVKYRVHANALTKKTISRWAAERRYTLNIIIKENVGIEERYKKAFKEAFARSAYYDMQYRMTELDKRGARAYMRTYRFFNFRYLILYLLTYGPLSVWEFVQKIKYKRALN